MATKKKRTSNVDNDSWVAIAPGGLESVVWANWASLLRTLQAVIKRW